MQPIGTTSAEILNSLQNDLSNEDTWQKLVDTQTAPAVRIQILEKAVATVPQSIALHRALINELGNSFGADSSERMQMALQTALDRFPESEDLWDLLVHRFPSVYAFNHALRYVPNHLVWPVYAQFLLNVNSPISQEERVLGLLNWCQFDPSRLSFAISSCVQSNLVFGAEQLLLHTNCSDWLLWSSVVSLSSDFGFLQTANEKFPDQTELIVPQLIRASAASDFAAGRKIALQSLESAKSVALFTKIFRETTALYEQQLERAFSGGLNRGASSGEFVAARLLAEFGNFLRKRSLWLNDAALKEFPHRIQLWLDRANLFAARPHIAADILEKAIAEVNPLLVVDGGSKDISDLYAAYASLLVANGSEPSVVLQFLRDCVSKPFVTNEMRVKLLAVTGNLLKETNSDEAIAALEQALQVPGTTVNRKSAVWIQYLQLLINKKMPDRLLAAFGRVCVTKEVTMRMCWLVANSFPANSANQATVFDQGVKIFPVPMVLPLWKQYLVAINDVASVPQLRGLYNEALASFQSHKKAYEKLVLQYAQAEASWGAGSEVLARRKLVHTLHCTTNPEIWQAYINTLSDLTSQREAYERAISILSPEYAYRLTLEFAALEEEQGQSVRANQLYEFARKLEPQPSHAQTIQFVPAIN